MMTSTVEVMCDHYGDGDYCEARFEVLRDGVPVGMITDVYRQLKLRGWTGNVRTKTTCPLHNRKAGDAPS